MFKFSHLFILLISLACLELQPTNPSLLTPIHPSSLELGEDVGSFCNDTAVPFPFGIPGLSLFYPGFDLTCVPKKGLYISLPNAFVRILEIYLNEGFLRVEMPPLFTSNASPLSMSSFYDFGYLFMEDSPYSFSEKQNKLTVIGCDVMVLLSRYGSTNSSSGCVSFCVNPEIEEYDICSGVGCCQAALPKNMKSININVVHIHNLTRSSLIPISNKRTFISVHILEQKAFEFSTTIENHLTSYLSMVNLPAIIDWSIGNKSCDVAKKSGDCICVDKAECINSNSNIGYLCRCMEGYSGNPYLKGGCKDINECSNSTTNPCVRRCLNSEGSYRCTCPFGTSGDGKKNGSGCKRVAPIEIALATGLSLLLILFTGGLFCYTKRKNKRIAKLKQKNFIQNGGMFLQKHWSGEEAAANIFSVKELETATDKFSESRILGRGGYGTVYRGSLADGRVVAIKKSKLVDGTQIEQFVNELFILSQINHRNVVKLLGCCLETQVPLLVYEFISNGTLFDHIHSNSGSSFYSPFSWDIRLRIAEETAVALAHLHKAASKPIIHRDVKTANILLDEQFIAKVSDFGASRLVPYNQTHVTTVVQGTLGYLDPEYFHTGLLTEKSDVYSFGVVLVELLTGKKPVSFVKSDEVRNLAWYFVRLVRENRLFDALDHRLTVDAEHGRLAAAAELAVKCLNVRGEDRPVMQEVAAELNALRSLLNLSGPQVRLGVEDEIGSEPWSSIASTN